jgi:hypothetical protein
MNIEYEWNWINTNWNLWIRIKLNDDELKWMNIQWHWMNEYELNWMNKNWNKWIWMKLNEY